MHETTVVIANSDDAYAGALAAMLAARGLAVVGIADDRQSLDALLPGSDVAILSEEFAEAIQGVTRVRSVVLVEGGTRAMLDAVAFGATGVVETAATFDEIALAVARVAEGHAVVPPAMLGTLLRSVVERRRREREAQRELEVLTPREREVFELTARGLDRDGIAGRLFISPATARTHLQRVFAKLGIHSRAEAVALAARCGLDMEEL